VAREGVRGGDAARLRKGARLVRRDREEAGFYDQLVKALLDDAGIRPVLEPPEGVEVGVREGGGRTLVFILNHTTTPKTIHVPAGKRELLTQQTTGETLVLGILGVAVLEM
jgi:beta-galactosidase